MLYKVIAAALLVASGDALNLGTGMGRRAAVAKVASLAGAAVPLAAFAELKKAKEKEISLATSVVEVKTKHSGEL